MSKGRITIPTDEKFVEGTKEIIKLWGADAVRDCDGTNFPKNVKELAGKVYKTYFVVRGDNEWGRKHPEEAHRTFLISDRVVATDKSVKISLLHGYLKDQFSVDYKEVKRWQAFDRTTCEEIFDFNVDRETESVTLNNITPYHEYTVNFMVKVLWHPVQIYNYLTNNWTCEKELMYDPKFTETAEYVKKHMREWCKQNPDVNVVRFTTFIYQFTLLFNDEKKMKYVDWFGYTLSCSPKMLDEFEKETGLKMTSEDIVDGGMYNNPFNVPKPKFLKYIDFVNRYVCKTVKELVDITHEENKEAMMFLGDDWIGTEPYGEHFKEMGLDAVVGSVGGGMTLRMISDIEGVKYTEGRFLPYFFPDTFFDGNENNAVAELNRNWCSARRAMLRKPLDRIGFGGYLSLAAKFPEFVVRASEMCEEFRTICDAANKKKPYCGLTVGVLSCWGKLRSWQMHMVTHEIWYQQCYSYQGVIEALSGMAVDVKFISFEDVRKGIDKDIDVIINVGDEDTSYSGGENWADAAIAEKIRKWVAEGHGFIGVGEPTACRKNDRCFVLSDVLGIDKEKGFTLGHFKHNTEKHSHFITDGLNNIDYGEGKKNIYAFDKTEVLDIKISDRCVRNENVGEVMLAANQYYKGRGVYISGLPYSNQNARLLLKALFWAANKESEMKKAYSENVDTECTYYPNSNRYAVINNTDRERKTVFFDINGNERELILAPNAIVWL